MLPGGWVELRLISNPGAAFSFGSGATWTFTLCATAVVAIVPWLAARTRFRARVASAGILIMRAMTDRGREHRVQIARSDRFGHP